MLWFTSSDALWSMFLVEDSCDEGFDVFEARPALRPCFFAVPSTEMLTDQDGQRGMSVIFCRIHTSEFLRFVVKLCLVSQSALGTTRVATVATFES